MMSVSVSLSSLYDLRFLIIFAKKTMKITSILLLVLANFSVAFCHEDINFASSHLATPDSSRVSDHFQSKIATKM